MRAPSTVVVLALITAVPLGCGDTSKPDASKSGDASSQQIDLPSLQATLDEKKNQWAAKADDETKAAYTRGVEAIVAAGVPEAALKVGDKAPDFELPNANGEMVKLSSLLEDGPVVLKWYRGAWCPYCNLELRAYQQALPMIEEAGATLVAITPQSPDKSLTQKEKQELSFEVLSDQGNKVAAQYHLVSQVTDEVLALWEGKLDLEEYNGDDSGQLPLAATYVVDADGVIRFAFAKAEYRERAEPADVVRVLRELKANRSK